MHIAVLSGRRGYSAGSTRGGINVSDTDQERDQAAFEQAKGRVKDAWGSLTGDSRTEAEGKVDQAKGRAREGLADAKDKIDATFERAKGKVDQAEGKARQGLADAKDNTDDMKKDDRR
jgi:uncharacterized protein YjbJ (UPF0337 family)